MNSINIAVMGASGYGGNELINILSKHPKIGSVYPHSRSNQGKKITDLYPDSRLDLSYSHLSIDQLNEMDIVFLALPKQAAAEIAPSITTKVIDLSPAHRFDKNYVYGLPEANKEKIHIANRIANPGCYATASILGILPLVQESISSVSFDCKSGYSGGGKNKNYEFEENVIPYSLNNHYQIPEIGKFLEIPFSFTPHVIDAFRGILATIHVFGELKIDLESTYKDFYKEKPFVKIVSEIPTLNTVKNTPYCVVGGFSKTKHHAIIVSTIDNLLKGAASQAVQNMNIMFGFNETEGLL